MLKEKNILYLIDIYQNKCFILKQSELFGVFIVKTDINKI